MTNCEALLSMSQTILRIRGEWVDGIAFSRDAANVVHDVWQMMRVDDDTIIARAVMELERRIPRTSHA